MDGDAVRVLELRRDLGFADKAFVQCFALLGIQGCVEPNTLDRDRPVEERILRFVDGAEGAGSELRDDLVPLAGDLFEPLGFPGLGRLLVICRRTHCPVLSK